MATKQRRNHDAAFKTKVVLEPLKGQKTTTQICSEYGIHVTQITHWKQQVLAGLPTLFGEKTLLIDEREKEELTAPLCQQIGQLKVRVDFLKKKLKQT